MSAVAVWPSGALESSSNLTGYRNRMGAVLDWWFAFTRDLRRERTFNMDDLPVAAGAYGRGQLDDGKMRG